jgi:cell division protein FtsL
MPAKKSTSRTSAKKSVKITRANEITLAIICTLFVIVGIFLVYKSFAASMGR